MNFSDRLKFLREELGLKQIELSEKLNMSNSTYNNYEIGIRTPDIETIKIIANFFDVSVDYIVGNTNQRKNIIYTTKNELKNSIIEKNIKKAIIIDGIDDPDDVDTEKVKKAIEVGLFKKAK